MMTRATHSPLYVTKELFETRFEGATAIFMAGSVVRGEASTYSDLDLVVVYPSVERAFRESFYQRGWPVEAFIHDPETINYFFDHVDLQLGRATLAEMISEGHEFPAPSSFTDELKARARKTLDAGPAPLTAEELRDRRYHISELLDDLREPRSRQELYASATSFYAELADYYFRSRRRWSGGGKAILKRLRKEDPAFARSYADAFDQLFTNGQAQKVIELGESVLSHDGGLLFEGYRQELPKDWRSK